MTTLRELDDQLFTAVNHWAGRTPALHGIFLGYATYGAVLFAALMVAALVLARHASTRDLAATGWVPLAMLLALALNQPLGRLVGEARPYDAHPGILRLVDATTDFSFPSDHSVMAGAVAAGLLLAHRRLGTVAVAAALLLGFSRVYVAAHYPWDVAAGLLFGAAVALGGWVVLRRPLIAMTRWLRRRPLFRGVFTEHGTPPNHPPPGVVPTRVRDMGAGA